MPARETDEIFPRGFGNVISPSTTGPSPSDTALFSTLGMLRRSNWNLLAQRAFGLRADYQLDVRSLMFAFGIDPVDGGFAVGRFRRIGPERAGNRAL